MKKVFLGGTITTPKNWRTEFIKMIEPINYFNPIVEDWNDDAQATEELEKWHRCSIHLYVITPEHKGFFTFAELIDSIYLQKQINKEDNYTIFCPLREYNNIRFEDEDYNSIRAISKIVKRINNTNAFVVEQLNDAAELIKKL